MKKSILVAVLFALMMSVSGQTIDLTFTAVDNEHYVQLDSIKVMNRTQGGDTVLFWPDTVLSLYIVGIDETQGKESLFQVFQNYPNPVVDQTTISFYIPSKDQVDFIVTDMLGRVIEKGYRVLDKGIHSYRFTLGEGNLYFFTADWHGISSSIKILQIGSNSGGQASLEYLGGDASTVEMKGVVSIQSFNFNIGDELFYIGYTGTLQSGMLDAPEESQTYTFQFATNIPCIGIPTVEYEGQVYNTIQIFSQCWLKENLNVGERINGEEAQTDNGIIEKYCYNDLEDNCGIFGGFYRWNEMMQYTLEEPAQGICPPGWHIPSDDEWKILEGSVDSEYGIGHSIWEESGFRGYDAGVNLKSADYWVSGGAGLNAFGFRALGAGYGGGYSFGWAGLGSWCVFWASTRNPLNPNKFWDRVFVDYSSEIVRSTNQDIWAYNVRCLKD